MAEELSADLVLIDDYWGRKMAEFRNLKITGSIGILIKAKEKGFIKNVKSELDCLLKSGFYINPGLYRLALEKSFEV